MRPSERPSVRREDFEVGSMLGEGKLCRVYLARNIHTKETVALKRIRKQKIRSKAILKMVLTERNILTRLNYHPNVISLWSTFQDESSLYFVLEYVPGGALSETLVRYTHHQINKSLSFYWVCDIVNVLCYLRSKGIIHRDIKTDNLMLDKHRRLRLIDFNSATVVEDLEPISHTDDMEVFGTLRYLSPELAYRIGPKLFGNDPKFKSFFASWMDNRSELISRFNSTSPFSFDLWAAGCVIFEILCGYHPFRASTDVQSVINVLDHRLTIPEHLLSKDEVGLIQGLLNPIPDARLGALDISELRNYSLFASMDLEHCATVTDRPPFVTVSTLAAPAAEIFEFTPDIGCSFGGVHPGLALEHCFDSAAERFEDHDATHVGIGYQNCNEVLPCTRNVFRVTAACKRTAASSIPESNGSSGITNATTSTPLIPDSNKQLIPKTDRGGSDTAFLEAPLLKHKAHASFSRPARPANALVTESSNRSRSDCGRSSRSIRSSSTSISTAPITSKA